MIRRVEERDIPWMLELGEKMIAESRYAKNDYSREKVRELLLALLATATGIVLRTDNGFIFGLVDEYWFGRDLYAFEYVLYVTPEARRSGEALELLEGYKAAALAAGVAPKDIQAEHSTGLEGIEYLFIRAGFIRVGSQFVLKES